MRVFDLLGAGEGLRLESLNVVVVLSLLHEVILVEIVVHQLVDIV